MAEYGLGAEGSLLLYSQPRPVSCLRVPVGPKASGDADDGDLGEVVAVRLDGVAAANWERPEVAVRPSRTHRARSDVDIELGLINDGAALLVRPAEENRNVQPLGWGPEAARPEAKGDDDTCVVNP